MAAADQTLTALIERARDASACMADRHEAFGEIARRFQDLAYACACARLRDAALAEDAAQDAFLVAWVRLGQLRDPAAFPGWIRRLVFTQCDRRLRSRRLPPARQEELRDVAAPAAAATDADTAHNATMVQLALAALGASDRLVLILFYVSERSQAEIAEWLGVPVTTVARRLAHARDRLRRHLLGALSGELRELRRGQGFLVELSERLRRATADDDDAIVSLRNRLAAPARRTASLPVCAYLVEDSGSQTPIAYAAAAQTIFEPVYDLQLAIGAAALRRHAGDVLLMQVIEDVAARGAIVLQYRTSARHASIVDFLGARGFRIVERAHDWRRAAGQSARLALTAPMEGRGEFHTLDVLATQARFFDALLDLVTEEIAGNPLERACLPVHPEALRRTLRVQRHGVVSIADGVLEGVLAGSIDQAVPAAVTINIILVRKSRRRRGLATAMLAHLLEQHGHPIARIVANEPPSLTAWLTHCGFVPAPDSLLLERVLRKTVRVPAERLDEYVGHYAIGTRSMPAITIERYADTLIARAGDMRDVLLAASECEFFTRYHYGRGRFERDDSGRIARLVYIEGPHEVAAIRQDGGSHRT
jgi:RNA polymerase sigma factor (sigma-70 family)